MRAGLERIPASERARPLTCPMHPEIPQDQPCYCPICRMPSKPVTVNNEPEAIQCEAKRQLRCAFWIATFLTDAVFPPGQGALHSRPASRAWIPHASTNDNAFVRDAGISLGRLAAFCFFVRGWNALRNRHLNMCSQISSLTGRLVPASALFCCPLFPSCISTRLPNRSRAVPYFEAAAGITRCPAGMDLEATPRSRTGAAIKRY